MYFVYYLQDDSIRLSYPSLRPLTVVPGLNIAAPYYNLKIDDV